jgi:hypothetical protein
VEVPKRISVVGFGKVTPGRERGVLIRWLTALKTSIAKGGISLDLM